MRPSLTFDDFFSGLLGALAKSKRIQRLPIGENFSVPLLAVWPDILERAEYWELELRFRYRVDRWGCSSTLEEAKQFAYRRDMLELRVRTSSTAYYLTDLCEPVLDTFHPSQQKFFDESASILLEEFRKEGFVQ